MKQPVPATPTTFSDVVLGMMGSFAGRFVHSFVLMFLGALLWAGGRGVYLHFTQPAGPAAEEPAALANVIPPRPPRYEPVTDAAQLLTAAEQDTLRARLHRFEKATTTQIVLVTVPSIGGEPVEDVAQRLYTSWGIGQHGSDNGVLLLVARREHRLRIQTGYGLEGAIPDAIAYRLIAEVLEPAFKQERYYQGLEAATTQLMRLARGESASFERAAGASRYQISFKTFACWWLGVWGFLLLRQCWRHGGISGLWAWKKSKWWTEGRQQAKAHNRRSSGGQSGKPRRKRVRDDDDDDRSSRSSSSSSDSSSDSSSSSSDWGGGGSGGGGASGGW
ncbi:TPM domain-containing protein [Hymenobacter negativus]|uniref:TPM domain-containing protein n=1 Tax=Hymenobacter negativus TaxID=2795026 RepID=A0ABS3QIL0_9BACT|nr:TPM domain-containing protein [Hymenobacter negativus]MBO2010941.1 TPM domain-containing protein [Hymenobacter negativus]